MSGFGASAGGGADEDVLDNDNPLAGAATVDAEPVVAAAPEDEPETLDVKEARRLAALPVEEMYLEVENGDASPKTKLFAVAMRLEQHQAQFDRMMRIKETLANEPAPWWHQYAPPAGHRMVDSRFRAHAKDKARSAFRDSGGIGPFAIVDTAREAVRFAANQVLDRLARRLLALADRFR